MPKKKNWIQGKQKNDLRKIKRDKQERRNYQQAKTASDKQRKRNAKTLVEIFDNLDIGNPVSTETREERTCVETSERDVDYRNKEMKKDLTRHI
ncbi:hypothetical protein AUR64_04025 [Haloprofundus marisrubri]|uniref:Uncharacterized protein n=1 Tax=Haloprofundus marisrubri TaxID=1514971 RepID=A0A0W1RE62_9EURY|nr:hypothetical protein [Haloprofundus marisrubri]KTG11430.1 hypothetical protein AUR64_04025 [Haloprofundus marisrubri]